MSKMKFWLKAFAGVAACIVLLGPVMVQAQAPGIAGTVKASTPAGLTVTDKTGKDVTVLVSDTTRLVQNPPGSKDLSGATPIAIGDIAAGDKVLVSGTAGDDPASLHARRVVVIKLTDITQNRAADEAAWQRGGGGLVKSVDPATQTIVVNNGAKTLTVTATAATKISRYAGGSVKFEDAVGSTFAAIQPGDQLRVRGTRSTDSDSITADAIVTGSFRNFSGVLTSIDSSLGTLTLRDLATKKIVIVKVSDGSDIRRLPPQAAARFAARAAGTPVGPAGAAPGSSAASAGGPAGSARAGMDLSQMLQRLPTETLGSLKVGDAVMIVASQGTGEPEQPVAVTVLAGVEPILQASPKGEMTLTPWSVGGGAPGGEGGGQ